MALVLRPHSIDEILQLARLLDPLRELKKLEPEELKTINLKIDDIAEDCISNPDLYAKLMRLKAYSMIAEESMRSAMGPGW